MRLARRAGRCEGETAAHAEVDDERGPAFEIERQVFAAPAEGEDRAAGERGEPAPIERLAQRPGAHLDPLDPPADQARLEAPLQNLDLGQLGHRRILGKGLEKLWIPAPLDLSSGWRKKGVI